MTTLIAVQHWVMPDPESPVPKCKCGHIRIAHGSSHCSYQWCDCEGFQEPPEVELEICTYMDSDSLPLNVDLIEEWGNLYCTTCGRIWECCQCDEPRQAIR